MKIRSSRFFPFLIRLAAAGVLASALTASAATTIRWLISAALLIFLFQWESFLWPLIATRSENMKVIPVALAGFEERYVTL